MREIELLKLGSCINNIERDCYKCVLYNEKVYSSDPSFEDCSKCTKIFVYLIERICGGRTQKYKMVINKLFEKRKDVSCNCQRLCKEALKLLKNELSLE